MKNLSLTLLGLLTMLLYAPSCSDDKSDSSSDNNDEPALALITPRIDVRMADPLNQNPFTGILEVYPCTDTSSLFYGNYINGKRTTFYGYYTIVNGIVYGDYNRELHLPTGYYNMVYWGTPKYDEPIHNAPQIVSPGLTEGSDLSQLYFALRPFSSDTTYSPVYDLVHAVKVAHIGTEGLQTTLTRIGAGLKVVVSQADDTTFPSEVTGIKAFIGDIAEKVNFYTGEAINMTKTVSFDLQLAADSLTYSNATVMLFPSAPNPPMTLAITLADGSVHTLTQNLGATLAPNTRLTLNLVIGQIIPGTDPGNITIEDWNEESETIEFPFVD